ncbi:hypothetical protein JB92DRAFT_2936468 [Gautieria morchelliformis]|nr:hypothetical protein JB92DRAFT_2936468 [Gautieria morchelliformis]
MSSAAITAKCSKPASSSKDAHKCSKSSKSAKAPPPIVALPSMSSHLFSLPQAKELDSLPVHPSQSAQRHAESEAKLKKALEWNARQNSQPTTTPSQYPVRLFLAVPEPLVRLD